jgi:phospholipase C
MALRLSRSGVNGEWRIDLPFNKSIALRLQLGVEEGALDTQQAFETTGNTHLWLVYNAVALLRGQGQAGERLVQLVKPWSAAVSDPFHDGLCRGLWDADNRSPYNDPIVDLVPTWASHFYDPGTRTNWMGKAAPTALSEGIHFYDESLEALAHGETRQAGYSLGLALHYLTDLTQPMHAANFTWMDSQEFGYHTDFERYVKDTLHRIRPPARFTPLLGDMTREAYFHAVARYSKDTYFALLCRPEWTQNYSKAMNTESVWEARVGALVPRMLGDAVQMTAQFLRQWARDVTPVKRGLLPVRA